MRRRLEEHTWIRIDVLTQRTIRYPQDEQCEPGNRKEAGDMSNATCSSKFGDKRGEGLG